MVYNAHLTFFLWKITQKLKSKLYTTSICGTLFSNASTINRFFQISDKLSLKNYLINDLIRPPAGGTGFKNMLVRLGLKDCLQIFQNFIVDFAESAGKCIPVGFC